MCGDGTPPRERRKSHLPRIRRLNPAIAADQILRFATPSRP